MYGRLVPFWDNLNFTWAPVCTVLLFVFAIKYLQQMSDPHLIGVKLAYQPGNPLPQHFLAMIPTFHPVLDLVESPKRNWSVLSTPKTVIHSFPFYSCVKVNNLPISIHLPYSDESCYLSIQFLQYVNELQLNGVKLAYQLGYSLPQPGNDSLFSPSIWVSGIS